MLMLHPDSVNLGMPSVDRGTMRARPVTIEDKAFVGNGALVREGATLGHESLIAVQSLAPFQVPPGSTFLGSPPLSVEVREKALGAAALTYQPSCCRRASRMAFELFALSVFYIYQGLFAAGSLSLMDLVYVRFGETHLVLFMLALPCVSLLMGVLLLLLIIVTKWVVMCGRFKPGVYPLFSMYVWRTELVERLEEKLAEPVGPPCSDHGSASAHHPLRFALPGHTGFFKWNGMEACVLSAHGSAPGEASVPGARYHH